MTVNKMRSGIIAFVALLCVTQALSDVNNLESIADCTSYASQLIKSTVNVSGEVSKLALRDMFKLVQSCRAIMIDPVLT